MDQKPGWSRRAGADWSRYRTGATVGAVLMGVVILLLWIQVGKWRDDRELQWRRQRVASSLAVHRNALASALANRFALLEGLRAFVEVTLERGERLEEQYPAFASRLYGVARGTRNLGVAPGGVYRLVYPLKGNEAILGYNLFADPRPEVVEDARRAMATRSLVVSGPNQLRQGGVGLIARGLVTEKGRPWGLVGIAFELDPILEEAQLLRSEGVLEAALRLPGQPPFFGPVSAFSPDALVDRVVLQDGVWEIAVRPAGGWQAQGAPARRLWLLSGIVLSLVPMALVLLVAWRQRLLEATALDAERRVEEGTKALRREMEARQELERRLREMLNNIQLIAILLDQEGRLTFSNMYVERLTGWSREELIGRDWFETCVPASARAAARLNFETGIGGGAMERQYENPIVTKSGATREIAWDTTILRDPAGLVIGLASFGRDVTDQRQLEAQYRQAQKMEAVGRLAGGVAHDFNNLLQVITGYAALVLGGLAPDQQHHAELTEIRRASERATALVRQLLAFSRRQKIERQALDINGTIANLLKMLRRLIGEHIELDFSPGCGVKCVFADAGMLEQVLLNLCVNARDAMPGGGRISISTANVTLGPDFAEQRGWGRAGEYVLLSVSDTGPGIPLNIRDRIFEPFFTTKEIGKGTGLGLATVYGIVKQHEGMIELASDEGPGASFRVYLPLADRFEERSRPDISGGSAPGGCETILIAEDEELVRSLARRVLESAGYRVLVAQDGEEAIALIASRSAEIDLALLDVVMPRANGREVGAHLKAVRPDVPILFCSGHSRHVLDENWVPEDGTELILKPYEPRALLERIHAQLRKKLERV